MGRLQVPPPSSASCGVASGKWRRLVPKLLPSRAPLGRVYRAQELHKLFADFGRGFVLYPVAHIVEFEIPHETGKTSAKLFKRGIKRPQAISFTRDIKRRLSDLRTLPGGGHIEIRFGG